MMDVNAARAEGSSAVNCGGFSGCTSMASYTMESLISSLAPEYAGYEWRDMQAWNMAGDDPLVEGNFERVHSTYDRFDAGYSYYGMSSGGAPDAGMGINGMPEMSPNGSPLPPGGGDPPAGPPPVPTTKPTPGSYGPCDPLKSRWGCFCFYSPPGGPYNSNEGRFADACLNAMGDPKQPERWSDTFNCAEIKSFKLAGGTGSMSFPGFKDWLQKMKDDKVRCFRGFMYSHSNGYANFVQDRTRPIMECIKTFTGPGCFSLHDCGCSTAKFSRNICERAQELSAALEASNSNMLVQFDAAKEDQALPGGLMRVDKTKFCAANPDGNVADEYNWRRVYVTRRTVAVYRHSKKRAGWIWDKMSPGEFAAYCAGRIH